jgi:hypothetical protein
MDKEFILTNINDLGARLHSAGINGKMTLYGGAVMALVHDSRRTAFDIDAVFTPHMPVLLQILNIHQEKGLPIDWINSSGSFVVKEDTPLDDFIEFPGLNIKVISPDYLLATKIMASRPNAKDFDDTRTLISILNIKTIDDAKAIVRKYSPNFQYAKNHENYLQEVIISLKHSNT